MSLLVSAMGFLCTSIVLPYAAKLQGNEGLDFLWIYQVSISFQLFDLGVSRAISLNTVSKHSSNSLARLHSTLVAVFLLRRLVLVILVLSELLIFGWISTELISGIPVESKTVILAAGASAVGSVIQSVRAYRDRNGRHIESAILRDLSIIVFPVISIVLVSLKGASSESLVESVALTLLARLVIVALLYASCIGEIRSLVQGTHELSKNERASSARLAWTHYVHSLIYSTLVIAELSVLSIRASSLSISEISVYRSAMYTVLTIPSFAILFFQSAWVGYGESKGLARNGMKKWYLLTVPASILVGLIYVFLIATTLSHWVAISSLSSLVTLAVSLAVVNSYIYGYLQLRIRQIWLSISIALSLLTGVVLLIVSQDLMLNQWLSILCARELVQLACYLLLARRTDLARLTGI